MKAKMCIVFCVCLAPLFLVSCATTPTTSAPKMDISSFFEPVFMPSYDFTPQSQASENSGYTVGIMKLQVEGGKNLNGQIFPVLGPEAFVDSFAKGLEKVFLAKGVGVKGPFDSYEEMTYPDRAQCSYLIVPVLDLQVQQQVTGATFLPETFHREGSTAIGYLKKAVSQVQKCTLRYEIFEPLSNQKLAVHKLDSEPVTAGNDWLFKRTNEPEIGPNGTPLLGSDGNILMKEKETMLTSTSAPGYYNIVNLDQKLLDRLYREFMPKTEALLSVEEFKHLDTYKKDLSEKKVY